MPNFLITDGIIIKSSPNGYLLHLCSRTAQRRARKFSTAHCLFDDAKRRFAEGTDFNDIQVE